MNMDAQQKLKLRRLLFIALLGMIGVSIVLALTRRGEWIIPEKAKQRVNPMQPSAQTLNAALGLYKENCARCHGDTGKGDGRDAWKHYTTPSDLTNAARMSNLTDGALFYQISEGRRPMPQFKTRLTEEQRWQVVLLIRSFAGATEKESKDP
jgi:mono/diheme cytochrome c family protein